MPGLIGAYMARPGKGVMRLSPEEIEKALAENDSWIWLHGDLIDQRTQGWIADKCGLPPAARAVLEGHDDSLVLGSDEGVIYGITADIHQDMDRMSTTIGRLHFAVSEHLLVTGRRHPLQALDTVQQSFVSGFCPQSAPEVLEAIITAFCKNTNQRLNEANALLNTVEDRLVTDNFSDERRNLKEVRRLAVSLHRPVAGMVSLFEEEDREDWTLPEKAHQVLDRLSTRLERLDREIVMVNDRARLLQEEMAAELADESNRSLKVMTVLSALLLPGTLIAGIFGMNTDGLPFTSENSGFAWAMVVCVVATLLFYWFMRKAGINMRFW